MRRVEKSRACAVLTTALLTYGMLPGCRRSDEGAPSTLAGSPPSMSEGSPPPAAPVAAAGRVGQAAGLERLAMRAIDVTSAGERPVDLGEKLDAILNVGSAQAGFVRADDGNPTDVEVHYGLATRDGKLDPRAERGLLVYGARVRVRVADDDGLFEIVEGGNVGEAPFVRAALPDLAAAFASVLEGSVASALRDVAMQLQYRSASEADAVKGLSSSFTEERCSSARRLAELGAHSRVPELLRLADEATGVELGVLATALGRLGDAAVVAPLLKRVGTASPSVAMAIVDALSSLDAPEARAALEKVAVNHPDPVVRSAARQALLTAE